MLVHYVGDYGLLNNSVHQDWQQHLSYIGFPRLTENIAIVNGRQFDRNTTLPAGSHLLYIDGYAKSSLLTDFISPLVGFYLWPLTYIGIFDKLTEAIIFLGSTKINVHAEVNPLSATNGGLILSQLEINYIKRLLWLFPKKYTVFSSTVNVPKTGLYYDDYPGSQYSLNKDIIDTTYNNRKMQRIPFAIIYKP